MYGPKALWIARWPVPTTDILAKVASGMMDLKAQNIQLNKAGTLMKNFLYWISRLRKSMRRVSRRTYEKFWIMRWEDVRGFRCCKFWIGITRDEAHTFVIYRFLSCQHLGCRSSASAYRGLGGSGRWFRNLIAALSVHEERLASWPIVNQNEHTPFHQATHRRNNWTSEKIALRSWLPPYMLYMTGRPSLSLP